MRILVALFGFLASCAVASAHIITPGSTVPGTNLPGGFQLGRFYSAINNAIPTNSALGAANRLFAAPFFVPQVSTAKTLSFDIGTGNAAAWNARMCIYADNGSGAPGVLVPNSDAGTIAIASGSVTGVQTATLNGGSGVTLGGPAWYWLAFMADSAGESLYSVTGTTSGMITSTLLGGSSVAGVLTSFVTGVFMPQTFGACPATFGTVSYTANGPTPNIVVGF